MIGNVDSDTWWVDWLIARGIYVIHMPELGMDATPLATSWVIGDYETRGLKVTL